MYPEPAALVGSRMPDYRDIFLRGHGSQTSAHYGTGTTPARVLGNFKVMEYAKSGESFPICPEAAMEKVGQSGSLAFWNEGRNQWINDAGKAPSGAMNFIHLAQLLWLVKSAR